MIYLKTVNLWDRATHNAIKTGQLKLQRGQWVQCGSGKKSRCLSKSYADDVISRLMGS